MTFKKSSCYILLIIFCFSCGPKKNEEINPEVKRTDSSSSEQLIDSSLSEKTIDPILKNESQHIEDIYLNVPSPMRTAIILNKAGVIYDHHLPLAPNFGHKYQTSDEQAIILGVYGTDLNYSVVSNEIMETELYLKSINRIGEKLGLDNILNEDIKTRVDNNIHRIDSMQVIISSLFWDVESTLKENDRKDISTLVVAGGWIEGLYIASQLSLQIPNNTNVTDLICKQKYSMQSLILLLNANEFSDQINEKLISPLNKLKTIFDGIKESVKPSNEKAVNEIQPISDNIILSYDQKTIDQIRASIQQIREDITN